MPEILRLSEEKGYRHYFYGSTEQTLESLERNLRKNYPRLNIAGVCSPPFRKLTEEEPVINTFFVIFLPLSLSYLFNL